MHSLLLEYELPEQFTDISLLHADAQLKLPVLPWLIPLLGLPAPLPELQPRAPTAKQAETRSRARV